MSSKSDTQRHLAALAPYLPHFPQVQHASLGVGVLTGLPATCVGDCLPVATVRFDGLSGSSFPDWYELSSVKLVLYAPEDAPEVFINAWNSWNTLDADRPKIWTDLAGFTSRLGYLAQIVDAARALGIALNLPAGSYIRKEVSRG